MCAIEIRRMTIAFLCEDRMCRLLSEHQYSHFQHKTCTLKQVKIQYVPTAA